MKILRRALVALAFRSGRLSRLMGVPEFRRILGPTLCAESWRLLGADIAGSAHVGTGVWMRWPKNVEIGADSRLAGRIRLDAWALISIGARVTMNDEITIFSGQHMLDSPSFAGDGRPVSIGDYAWLPHHIIVLPGVTIEHHAVVATGSVVSRSVPAFAVVAGNPARHVRDRAAVEYTYLPNEIA